MPEHKFYRGNLDIPVLGDYLQKAKKPNEYRNLILTQIKYGSDRKRLEPYREEIESDSVFKSWNGKKLPWGVFYTSDLVVWFIWRINEVGIRRARADLKRLRTTKVITGKYISPVVGYRCFRRVKLFGNYAIEPFENLPLFSDKIASAGQLSVPGIPAESKKKLGKNESRSAIQYGYKGKCALTYTLKYEIGTPYSTGWTNISNEINAISILASCLEDTRMCVNNMVFTTLDTCPFGLLSSGSSETQFGTNIKNITDARSEEYDLNVKDLRALFRFTENNTIPNYVADALYYLQEAKFKSNDVEAYLYMGMALEIGLANGVADGNKDSISSTIRRRAAWLIGKDYTERKNIFKEIGNIYALRSSAVHTGGFDKKKKRLSNRKDHQNLCSRILHKLVLEGKIKFDRLVMGG